MTKMKDKLSASVRMAKASQKTPAQSSGGKPAPVKTVAAKPAAPKPAARPPVATAASRKAQGNEVPVRSEAMFPARVWPD